ncbi:MAG: hypothetical protein C0469_08035 [Cyanobacteria bacterium DS2.3.42]|nr:hypothetical protein [Cyanobacteria bacterium DS2.3.42]
MIWKQIPTKSELRFQCLSESQLKRPSKHKRKPKKLASELMKKLLMAIMMSQNSTLWAPSP